MHPNDNDVKVTHQNKSNFFESLFELKETIHVSGMPFNTGGLYLFKVEIISTEYGESDPISFDAGLNTTKEITSNSTINFVFDVKDLSQDSVITSVDYDVTVIHDKNTLFSKSGKSNTSEKVHNEFSMFVPKEVSGVMSINFFNIDGNKLGKAIIPIDVNKIQDKNIKIPDKILHSTSLWSQGYTDDLEFFSMIEFLMKDDNIISNKLYQANNTTNIEIPDWVKTTASWWSEGLISDEDFVDQLKFLVKNNIIFIP